MMQCLREVLCTLRENAVRRVSVIKDGVYLADGRHDKAGYRPFSLLVHFPDRILDLEVDYFTTDEEAGTAVVFLK
jgi:hypothetical protein